MAEETGQTDVEEKEPEAEAEAVTTEAAPEPEKAPEAKAEAGPEAEAEAEKEQDWRAAIEDPKLRDMAGRFTSPADAVKMAADLRAQLSKAPPTPPGKDASEDDVKAYLKKIGVPEEYKFDVPEGRELTDGDKAFQTVASQTFRDLWITGDQAKGLNAMWNETLAAAEQARVKAEEDAMAQAEAALRKEWPGKEYEVNSQLAGKAWKRFGAEELEDIKLEGGTRLGDHPALMKMMAQIQRLTAETAGILGMSDTEVSDLETEYNKLMSDAQSALDRGDRAEAQRLTDKRMKLAAKRWGTAPAPSRAA